MLTLKRRGVFFVYTGWRRGEVGNKFFFILCINELAVWLSGCAVASSRRNVHFCLLMNVYFLI
jgi:hypothetical protein